MNNRVAIVGIGGVFPGATDLDSFWELIRSGASAAREVPPGRWALDPEQAWSRDVAADKVLSKRGCFVDPLAFNPEGLNLDPTMVAGLDPVFHLLLHAGCQAWQDADTEGVDRSKVGVVIGNIVLPTDASSALADEILGPAFESQVLGDSISEYKDSLRLNRYVAGLPAGVLAKGLELGGGSYTLDAACASSLYALKYAAEELLAGRCDAMLAGGLSRPDCLYTQMGFSQLQALSRSGVCSPFDHKGDGLVVGEGAGIVVLKRLEDALEQGDEIYATIAGIGLSNDVGGNLMSPDSEGQLRAMRAAYQQAGWSPDAVDLIECHGTGTPIGDAVEVNSLKSLWGDPQQPDQTCVIGSVKSNIGHLLTAAGSAGLIKVLLAIKHGRLPPTANFESAAASLSLEDSPFAVLTEPREWLRRDAKQPRRAAISAFGFGGINAHLLLQEWDDGLEVEKASEAVIKPAIAVVGMEAQFGPWQSLAAFRQRVFGFDQDQQTHKPENWWGVEHDPMPDGFYIDQVSIPLGRFRIPPAELAEMLPQQLLMLTVAAAALDDAGLGEAEAEPRNATGVYIGIGLDLNTTNFHFRWTLLNRARQWNEQLGLRLSDAELSSWTVELRDAAGPALNANRTMGALGGIVASRIARAFRIGGPSFTVSDEEASGLRALESGLRALQRGEIDTAVVGAVDLAGDVRATLGQIEDRPLGDKEVMGEGATALVLKRHQDALRDGDRIYALVEGMGSASEGGVELLLPAQDAYQRAVQRACEDAGVSADGIGLIERHGSGTAADEAMESRALSEMLASSKHALPCVDANLKSEIGHCGAAGGLASVARASLSLFHRTLPPRQANAGGRYWLQDRENGPRQAMVASCSIDGNCVHAVLGAADNQENASPTSVNSSASASLFVFSAASDQELLAQLRQFESRPLTSDDIQGVALEWWRSQAPEPLGSRLSLLAEDTAMLSQRIKQAQELVSTRAPSTCKGVFHTPNPLGLEGKVAFVYPGSGNHFHNMGRELAIHWPAVLERLEQENQFLGSQFAGGRFWQDEAVSDLDHQAVIFGQVWIGTLVSDVISQFGLQPDAIIGYSLGETAGLFSTRSWTDRDEMLRRMQQTDLFTRQLAGPCEAVRKSWNLGPGEQVDWLIGMLGRSADTVRQSLAGKKRIYLLIINTPNECVIGGDREEVLSLAKDLGCVFHPIQGVTTVHSEVARPVEKPYRDLHLFDTTPPENVLFYSGVWGRSYPADRESCADSIVQQALQCFDYTQVIESAYADGARIFIEMGPGGSCSRMIGQILGDRPHLTKAICVPGQDEVLNVLELLARLHAEGLTLNLDPLFDRQPSSPPRPETGKQVSVPTGGRPFKVPAPPSTEDRLGEPLVESLNQAPAVASAVMPDMAAPPQAPNELVTPLIDQMQSTERAKASAQEAFLRVSNGLTESLAQALGLQMSLLHSGSVPVSIPVNEMPTPRSVAFDRRQCMAFAIGSIGQVLGAGFADIDQHPTRVRLPDEPLMLVDRIMTLEGEPDSMGAGRVTTEHDVLPGAWYLDSGRIPTCIAVEAGQADLFLSAYLGIDHQTMGQAVYRLLDAKITFHGPLPRPGDVIHYDIRIDHFFRQDQTWLFRFGFEGTVNGQPLLTMTEGCAGFFSQAELDAGRGIVETSMERRPLPGKLPQDWAPWVPMQVESYDDRQITALASGDLQRCFGPAFSGLPLRQPVGLPGGRMSLVHRVLELDPEGGRFGIGQITGEADIQPDDWFLTCHFSDDQVMPGTLMYECCLHTLRIYLSRMGWVGECDAVVYEPVQGEVSQLKCRGQVLASTRKVQYQITLKEIGYQDDGTPYVLANALMSADGRAIVQMNNMSVQLSGITRGQLEALWANRQSDRTAGEPLFDFDSIYAFARGNPSQAFGDRYRVFDQDRIIARLPGPPYQFLDRIVAIDDCQPWVLAAGGSVVAEYDVPADAWYFEQDRQQRMPFAVLLEVALQPCGWLAAYLGSALTSEIDLSFRNLGGKATQLLPVTPDSGTLATRVKITSVSQSGGMIIQSYDMQISSSAGLVYQGITTFGFFSKQSLADQVGIREAEIWQPGQQEEAKAQRFSYPQHAPYPDQMMRMVHAVDHFDPGGGKHQLGFIRGTARVDPEAWFFKAHFYQDPVWPGSLGLESLIQLLKIVALDRWQDRIEAVNADFEVMALNQEHSWVYRGQIIPADQQVTVQATILNYDDQQMALRAEGYLSVDGRIIYQMNNFALKIGRLK